MVPLLGATSKEGISSVSGSHSSGPCWCSDDVDGFGIGSIPRHEQTTIFGFRVSEPDYLVWLRPLIASSKGSVALFNITRLTEHLMELGMFPIGVISVVSFFVEMFSWWEPVPIRKGDSDLRHTAKAGSLSQGQINSQHLRYLLFLAIHWCMCKPHLWRSSRSGS